MLRAMWAQALLIIRPHAGPLGSTVVTDIVSHRSSHNSLSRKTLADQVARSLRKHGELLSCPAQLLVLAVTPILTANVMEVGRYVLAC